MGLGPWGGDLEFETWDTTCSPPSLPIVFWFPSKTNCLPESVAKRSRRTCPENRALSPLDMPIAWADQFSSSWVALRDVYDCGCSCFCICSCFCVSSCFTFIAEGAAAFRPLNQTSSENRL